MAETEYAELIDHLRTDQHKGSGTSIKQQAAEALSTLLASEERLSAALLWLRNHYDVGKQEHKQEVLARIDAVLQLHPPSISAMAKFREDFPRAALNGETHA